MAILLVKHGKNETLAISNCFASLTKSKGRMSELTGKADNIYNEAVAKFLNSYQQEETQLHNFTSGQVVPQTDIFLHSW